MCVLDSQIMGTMYSSASRLQDRWVKLREEEMMESGRMTRLLLGNGAVGGRKNKDFRREGKYFEGDWEAQK